MAITWDDTWFFDMPVSNFESLMDEAAKRLEEGKTNGEA